MPVSLDVLVEERFLPEPRMLECSHGPFRYVSGLRTDMPPDFVLAFEAPSDGSHRNVLFIAGNVDWMPEEQLEARLAHTLEGAAKLGFEAKVLGQRE